MLERQRERIAKPKDAGKYKGRNPTTKARADEVEALADQGMSMGQIAAQLGIRTLSIASSTDFEKGVSVFRPEFCVTCGEQDPSRLEYHSRAFLIASSGVL